MDLYVAINTELVPKSVVRIVSRNTALAETTDTPICGHLVQTSSQDTIRYESLLDLEYAREKQGTPICFGARSVEDL
jgi:ACT domain-containing protein